MADRTTGIPQGGATTPVTPPAQDLQINLADAPKIEIPTPENTPAELDLSLDLNLPEAPKTDDRLKTEDQKNTEVVATPVVETVAVEPVIEPTPVVTAEPVVEPVTGIPTEVIASTNKAIQNQEIIPEPVAEIQPATEVTTPSTIVETIPSSSDNLLQSSENNPLQSSSLKEDMKIIDDLEGHPSAGGLAPEATVAAQPTPVETPKTFDLDAMLGSPTTPPVVETPQPVMQMPPIPMPAAAPTPVPPPAFIIPSSSAIIGNNPLQSSVPVQAVMQTNIPQKKNAGVKALLFVVLFVALGFTTFFILKTMYPVEFGNIFSGGETQMHAIEEVTGTIEELTGSELTGSELTGTEIPTEQMSGEIDTGTGTHESPVDNVFGELNDLGTTPAEPEQNDVSKLTNYVNLGNDFLAQGKAIGNNTVIKYGLYISKKSTTFLEKIANGEEISNLSGYFAQFDQYIAQLETLLGTSTTAPTTEPVIDEGTSSLSETTNDQSMNQGSTPTPEVTTE